MSRRVTREKKDKLVREDNSKPPCTCAKYAKCAKCPCKKSGNVCTELCQCNKNKCENNNKLLQEKKVIAPPRKVNLNHIMDQINELTNLVRQNREEIVRDTIGSLAKLYQTIKISENQLPDYLHKGYIRDSIQECNLYLSNDSDCFIQQTDLNKFAIQTDSNKTINFENKQAGLEDISAQTVHKAQNKDNKICDIRNDSTLKIYSIRSPLYDANYINFQPKSISSLISQSPMPSNMYCDIEPERFEIDI